MRLLIVLCFASVVSLADAPAPAATPKGPRYSNIVDDSGLVVAVVDTQDKDKVSYKADPKEVVSLLIKRYVQLDNQCRAAMGEAQKKIESRRYWYEFWLNK